MATTRIYRPTGVPQSLGDFDLQVRALLHEGHGAKSITRMTGATFDRVRYAVRKVRALEDYERAMKTPGT